MKVTEKKYLNVHQTISPLTSSTNSTHSSKSAAAAAAVAAANNLANGLLVAAAGDVGDDYNANKANEKILVSPQCPDHIASIQCILQKEKKKYTSLNKRDIMSR